MKKNSGYNSIYRAVMHIPYGKVATYGQIARVAGIPGHARQVGYALHRLHDGTGIPWHRVINGKGRISLDPSGSGALQRMLLESEGVVFMEDGSVPLEKYGWEE
jgi:methylated-DNA-protein-cysteine methyltransferase related protein